MQRIRGRGDQRGVNKREKHRGVKRRIEEREEGGERRKVETMWKYERRINTCKLGMRKKEDRMKMREEEWI